MRIGIVHDDAAALEQLQQWLVGMPEHTKAWLARGGQEAVVNCSEDTPDLILMKLVMPGMDGVEATRRIMQQCPCAILMLTASVQDQQALVFAGLTAGALDVAVMPPADGYGAARYDALQKKVSNISRLIGKHSSHGNSKAPTPTLPNVPLLIAIGASTGGPAAVVEVLKSLPAGCSAAVVAVVHVDQEFAPGMAVWMKDTTGLPVHIVREGEQPKAGEVLLAATNEHLVVNSEQLLHYTPEPADYPYRPSVDVFFSSLVQHWPGEAIGVLLTGMGRDGAKGLKSMREHGWHTIAQDEKTSAIYGMPKAAAQIGAASEILPLERIGQQLLRLMGQRLGRPE